MRQQRPFLSLRWKTLILLAPLLGALVVLAMRCNIYLDALLTAPQGGSIELGLKLKQQASREFFLLLAGTLIIGALTLALLFWPRLKRLKCQAAALPLLGRHQFDQARQALNKSNRWHLFDDEVDLLDRSTLALCGELEQMEREIDRHSREIEQVSLFDPLTGLANRNLFLYELQRALKAERETTAMLYMLDLDRFKSLNDALGHQLGDQLLTEVGNRLKRNQGKLGTLARLGGDEFAILCTNLKQRAQAEPLGNKILELISKPITISEQTFRISCSMGMVPVKGQINASELIRHAEIAMYKAKEAGGGRLVSFDTSMAQELLDKHSLENEIRRGFAEQEFTLFLQPKVNMNEKTEAFEALIRWDHPERGLVPPDEFIPAMEAMGFIEQMDKLVLESACRQLKTWRELYPDISIAVNISSTHMTSPRFIEVLKYCLETYQINPAQLELEITETLLMENVGLAVEVLHQIKALGVHIAIDDFGTGYSSLSYLKNLPIDTLKIDREFIKDIPDSERDMQISSVIIFLAKQLGFTVVAEGVETLEQLVFLKANHCDLAQGYYFSKPVPAHKAVIMLEYERGGASLGGDKQPDFQSWESE